MSQIRFVGGPWDGAAMPWEGGGLPADVRMPHLPTELSNGTDPLPAGPFRYRLESGSADPVYRYVGRCDPSGGD